MNKQQPPLTLTTFAKAKLLPLEFLESAGLSDSPRGVLFPYGPGFRLRIRLSMDRPADGPDKRFAWADKRTSAEEVGCYTADVLLEHLRPKAHEPECYIVEGESDALTLWHAGMPAVGVPGAQMAGKLTSNHVAAFSSVVVWQEPGPGGEAFKTGVLARLTAVGYTDRVNVVAAKSDKDASALWLRVGGDRTTFMAELLRLPVAPVTPPAGQEPPLIPVPLEDFMEQNPELPAPVVHGLMREGETMNIIANTKVGKSWLAMDLALSVATGRPWLATFPTARGRVLVIDNELLPGVLARRPGLVAAARGIPPEEYKGMIDILSLRGRLRPLDRMADFFDALDPGAYKVIVLDAWYRFLPPDVSENGNGEVAQIYNTIDKYAGRIGASCVPIHHATKGNQSDKKVTDVGAGAGAQSRAADTHLVIREHAEKDCFVIDAAVRSFAPIEPLCVRWGWPVFNVADGLDPTRLIGAKPAKAPKASEYADDPDKPDWTPEYVAKQVEAYGAAGVGKTTLHELVKTGARVKDFPANRLIDLATEAGLIRLERPGGRNVKGVYVAACHASAAQPGAETGDFCDEKRPKSTARKIAQNKRRKGMKTKDLDPQKG